VAAGAAAWGALEQAASSTANTIAGNDDAYRYTERRTVILTSPE
jgi:hypothetical protein